MHELHETQLGRRFYEGHVPAIAEALKRIAAALEAHAPHTTDEDESPASSSPSRVACITGSTPAARAKNIAGDRPFRAPHHTTSLVGIRDECRLSVGGVLYLEDAAEFPKTSISAVASCIRQGSRFGPAIVAIDARPLPEGDVIHSDSQAMHEGRIKEIVKTLTDAAQEANRG